MGLQYKYQHYLGAGSESAVFAVEWFNSIVALKLFFQAYDGTPEWSKEHCATEYFNLEKLSGIVGIPQPVHLLGELKGTTETLGVILNEEIITQAGNREVLYFGGAFLMEYMKDIIPFSERKTLSPELRKEQISPDYFDNLENIASQVHARGISLPLDLQLFALKGQPVILDWTTVRYMESRPRSHEIIKIKDFTKIDFLRKKYESLTPLS